jgi:hypothetical protein
LITVYINGFRVDELLEGGEYGHEEVNVNTCERPRARCNGGFRRNEDSKDKLAQSLRALNHAAWAPL